MNQHIALRLNGIHSVLCSAFAGGDSLTSASKGHERETFISLFLAEVLPPIYRFGTGDITDSLNNNDATRRSGQIDIVIEMPWAPSFPSVVGSDIRVYPAEAVGAAIEVKSNLSAQWAQVISTAKALSPLRQKLSGIAVDGGSLSVLDETEEPIPLYAVGYEGWSTAATVEEKARDAPLDGIFILKHKIFACSDRRPYLQRLLKCQVALDQNRTVRGWDTTLATCARLAELSVNDDTRAQMTATLNAEKWATKAIHFGDQEYLPEVDQGGWTEPKVEQLCKAFLQKTKVWVGTEAILQFVAVVHREVAKRAAMSVDLSRYIK